MRTMNREKGQVLPLALVALAIGTVIITPFIGHAGSNLIGSRIYAQAITGGYSSDAGIEHAIWRLTDDDLTSEIPSPGDTATYQLGETVNGIAPDITVTRDMAIIVSDGFESADWSGGSGWLADWANQGDASIVTGRSPYQGSYHLRLRSNTGYVKRSVDLSRLLQRQSPFLGQGQVF